MNNSDFFALPHWDRETLLLKVSTWCHTLDAIESNEIENALEHLMLTGKTPLQCLPTDFPLPRLHKVLERAVTECEFNSGVFLLRGLPILNKTLLQVRWLAWGIGLHLGVPLIQNQTGDLLVDVQNSDSLGTQQIRGHCNANEMEFHVDSCDLVTLLCVSKAAEGGRSKVASSVTINHRLAKEYHAECRALYEALPFIDPSKTGSNTEAFFKCPVFAQLNGSFTCRFYRKRILAGLKLSHFSMRSPITLQALDLFHDIASSPDSHIEMELEPGDLQCLNNHVVCHARTAFRDGDEPSQKRHLLRQWFATASSRPLPDSLKPAYGRVEAGTLRGGYRGWSTATEILVFQAGLARCNRIKL